MDDCKARLDLPSEDTCLRHQGPVFGIDIVPGDTADRRSLWYKYGGRAGPAVRCSYRYCSALPVAPDVVGRWGSQPDFVDQLMDNRVADFIGCRVDPREIPIDGACSEEVGRAVRHFDQVARVPWPGERREAGSRHRDTRDRPRCDVCRFCCVGGGLGEGVVGMAARHQLDCHIGNNVPALAQITGDAITGYSGVYASINLEKSIAGFENALFALYPRWAASTA